MVIPSKTQHFSSMKKKSQEVDPEKAKRDMRMTAAEIKCLFVSQDLILIRNV